TAGVPRWEYNIGVGAGDTSYSLTISGGWSDCSTQVADPRLTELDAQYQGSVMYFRLYNSRVASNIHLSNLTLTRGAHNGSNLNGRAAGLSVNAPYSGATVLFERIIVIAGEAASNSSATGGVEFYGFPFGDRPTFRLRNSIIVFNRAPSIAGVSVRTNNAIVNLTNNTIHSNTLNSGVSNCGCVGLDLANAEGGTSYISNNVVYNNRNSQNGMYDFVNDSGNSYLRNNHFGTARMLVAPVLESNSSTGDPGWTIVGIFPIPNVVSPLRNSGYNTPAGGVGSIDIEGNMRVINGTVDRGALEADSMLPPDAIFASAFNA
ncbi:MAG: hypothetical protein JNN30_07110, partial [Rhodanobacteraceae bacterium]|nr:hypothetical protein [Rhodanobacteraceae bacterium]